MDTIRLALDAGSDLHFRDEFQDPSTVSSLTNKDIIEEDDLSVKCSVTNGNPSQYTVYWTKTGDSGFRQNGAVLRIQRIQRGSAGTYTCTAQNSYSIGGTGSSSQSMTVNVLYPPVVLRGPTFYANESQEITLFRNISSNPASDVSWFKGSEKVHKQESVTTAKYTIDKTKCTDTGNYTLKASNKINSDSAQVQLFVYCIPQMVKNITLGITDEIGIEFSVNVIAYPKPSYQLTRINKTVVSEMTSKIFVNAVNNFTIRYNQTSVTKSDYGVYILKIKNTVGEADIYVDVIPKKVFVKSTKESSIGGITGGTVGGVLLIILITLIFLNRKYQIKCHVSERMPKP
ncbi:limbic system-associated membrane protein-like, partial [Saccostrea cucullata]|uniref:limbic system-associated membrane protein-like n=1 Tax=Saccostrea cuccullata TaxID=36930 RepID=UPI002ED21DA1